MSRKPSGKPGRSLADQWLTCEYCGKRGWKTRRGARAGRSLLLADGKGRQNIDYVLVVYECTSVPDGVEPNWHMGHHHVARRPPNLNDPRVIP